MENEKNSAYKKGFNAGIILIIIGVVFLGFNFGWFPAAMKKVVFSWQMLLLIFGIINLSKKNFTAALILIFIGGFFILPRLSEAYPQIFHMLGVDFVHNYWPLLLILLGLFILLHRKKRNRANDYYSDDETKRPENKENVSGRFDKTVVFSGGEYIFLDEYFEGACIEAVFGGIELDLRKTDLHEGITKIEIEAVFGGVKIFVPASWYLNIQVDGIFGGVEDKRIDKNHTDKSKTLLIKGDCVFGGCEIRN